MSNGRDTLDRAAPEAARALRVLEVTAWDQAEDIGLLDLAELIGRVCGSTLGLAPLTPPSPVAPTSGWSCAFRGESIPSAISSCPTLPGAIPLTKPSVPPGWGGKSASQTG